MLSDLWHQLFDRQPGSRGLDETEDGSSQPLSRAAQLINFKTLSSLTALDTSFTNRIAQLRKLTQHLVAD